MLAVTASAATAIRDIAENADLPGEGGGLRFSLAATNGDDAQLQVALVRVPREGDEELERDGAYVYLDAEASLILSEKVLDAELMDDGHAGFSLVDQA